MNKISLTSKYNKNMIPCIIFGEYGWNFIFVDTKNNQCIKDEDVTMAWLTFIFNMWVMIMAAIAIIVCIAKNLASPEDWRAMTGNFSSSYINISRFKE